MRREEPRPFELALRGFERDHAPATLLARVQSCWREAVGPAVADEAMPASERDGVVTVDCRSSLWAQELELLGPDLVERLNRALGEAGEGPVKGLRSRTRRPS